MHEKIQKMFFLSEIIASELVSLNFPCGEEDTFHWQALDFACQQERLFDT